jgi:hypothetical protein
MRQLTLLNSLLAANAVLLGGLLWTQIAERPFAESAVAAPQSSPTRSRPTQDPLRSAQGGGVPNAGQQRLDIYRELLRIGDVLDQQSAVLESMGKAIASGTMAVDVTNVDEFASAIAAANRKAAAKSDAGDAAAPPPPIVRPSSKPGSGSSN